MSAVHLPAPRAAALAPAARLLASWWSRPTGDEVERWNERWRTAREATDSLRLPRADVERLETAVAAASPAALLEEYERLLVGPGRVPCAPYESLWRADAPRRERGVLMSSAAADIVRIYRELGLQVRMDAHELPDHLAIEWEALAFAFEHDADDLAAALLHDHVAHWVPAFCAAVAAETQQPFYATLAPLTGEWAAALAA